MKDILIKLAGGDRRSIGRKDLTAAGSPATQKRGRKLLARLQDER